MAYAQGRVIFDSDSHIMETLDWLERGASKDDAKLPGSLVDAQNAGAQFIAKVVGDAEGRRADPDADQALCGRSMRRRAIPPS